MKLSTFLACVVLTLLSDVATAGLLRVPKVYNALITTNENLVPSRAIPVATPVLHPIALAPAVPLVITSPYISFGDTQPKSNKTDTEAASESDKKPEDDKNATANSIPGITPFSLPLAYYNSITYYHNLWPYSYSSVSPATFVFTAPFTYPATFGNLYGSLPWSPVRNPGSDSASSKETASGSKDDPEKESVSVDAS